MNNYSEISSLLEKLCGAKGVSGAENEAADVVSELLGKYMPVSVDPLGSVTGTKGSGKFHILLDAHLDQIGLVVTAIDEDGFLKVAKCGGADIRVLAASEVTVHGKEKLFGVITSTPPHLVTADDSGKAKGFDDIAVDIGMSKEEAVKYVSLGDRITFNGKFTRLAGNRVSSPSIDDRAGVAAILRCLEILDDKEPDCKISVCFSVQEETGGSGAQTAAFTANADEAIAVDVSFASAPDISSEKYATLGAGAMIGYAPSLDYDMSRKLSDIAEKKNIPNQPEVMGGKTGTNCDEIQVAGKGVRTALISVPLRNMHTAVEVCDLEDIENTARLMAEYIIERSGADA
ncbi:MAG: M20/M25/M40 family metallo-hydrolase [Acutalibacteraceae bacterium]|nr:M20/M25/M40 family metallo-hydrolase [Acutalibacteraceae bacterium]